MVSACIRCHSAFEITERDLDFYRRVSPVFNGKQYLIPPPTHCPTCRLQRRLSFRSQIFIYAVPSVTAGKKIFSSYPPEIPFPVLETKEWWGDGWDPLDFGQAADFEVPVFDQVLALRNVVPHYALSIDTATCENSDFCNHAGWLKNCYLVFNTNNTEDCLYSENVLYSKDCIDCARCPKSELCYDCVECAECYNLQSSEFCDNCSDSYFLSNCRSCRHCIGCVNLRHAEYSVFNKQYTKEQYQDYLKGINLASFKERSVIQDKFSGFKKEHPRPHVLNRMVENATGNYIFESRAVHDSYFVRDAEDVRFGFNLDQNVKDCYDYSLFGCNAELLYECVDCGYSSVNMQFCMGCWDGNADLLYCTRCMRCEYCFGCVGLKNKRFCIFNKQYAESDYKELVPQIIEHMQDTGEWGEFFPHSLSPIPYNHSYAYRYFPLPKAEALSMGMTWHDKELVSSKNAVPVADLPDRLPDTDEPFTALSASSGKAFRITTQELQKYRRLKVPLPRAAYDERMEQRAKRLGGIELFERQCAKTGQEILTTYPPDSP
ncbi:hypothetical protein OAO01_05470, partial [Oligoflexia bacterium]|nr:hypothetical protein [Oligoflexia bacterium]